VYALPSNTILNKRTVVSIYANGYSRVPIYEERPTEGDLPDRSGVIGILMTRQLIVVDWDHERDIETLTIFKAPCVSPRIDLLSLTNLFQTGGSHIALVCAQPNIANKALDNDLAIPVEAGFMGIVTLEGKCTPSIIIELERILFFKLIFELTFISFQSVSRCVGRIATR